MYLNKPLAVCIRTSGLAVPWEGSPQREDTLGGSFKTSEKLRNFYGLVVLATKLRVIINSGITSLDLIPES